MYTNKLKKEVEKLVEKDKELHKKIEEISQEQKALVMKYEVKRAENVATHGTFFELLLTIAPLSSRFLKNNFLFY